MAGLILVLQWTGSPPVQCAPAKVMTDSTYVGAITCQTSLCHGGSSPQRGQFVSWIWSQQDYHSRSYMTLVQSRSTRIAEAVGIRNPATDNRCAACHAPLALVAPAHRATTAQVTEGVSCESCHAPAGDWLRSHTRPDFTHAQRVASGMADLQSLYLRANSCVACHQNIDPALVGAGHPLLFFELSRQSEEEPAHWEDKDSWSATRAWLIGQCVAFREVSWKLSLGGQDPNTLAQWDSLSWLLQMISGPLGLNWPAGDAPKTAADYTRWVAVGDGLARQAQGQAWSGQKVVDCLTKLGATSASFGPMADDATEQNYYRFKRLAFAVDCLQKPLKSEALARAGRELIDLSQTPASFVPDKVAAALASLKTDLPKAGP